MSADASARTAHHITDLTSQTNARPRGKTCAACKQKNHFAGSPACQATTVRALSEAQEEISYTLMRRP